MYNFNKENQGTLTGVGVGPGDPELLTLKAIRYIKSADVISYICNENGESHSKTIVEQALDKAYIGNEKLEIPVLISMSIDRKQAKIAYDTAAETIQNHLDLGKHVVFLCLGDPLFYGSFTNILQLLQSKYVCHVVPGVAAMHAASAKLKIPLALLSQNFAVVSPRQSDAQIIQTLNDFECVVIMKAGRERERIIRLIQQSGRMLEAYYVENLGMNDERIVVNISILDSAPGSYFSMFIITRHR